MAIFCEGKNKTGIPFKIMQITKTGYTVIKFCENYNGNVRGGMVGTWRLCMPNVRATHADHVKMQRDGMTRAQAIALFNKRIVRV